MMAEDSEHPNTWIAEIEPPLDMSPSIGFLAAALAKAQGAMEPAALDRENPGFHFRYATLASVWESIRKPLSMNGLAVSQDAVAENGRVGVVTMLVHSSGEWKRSRFLLKPLRDDPQGAGSALTYARRYALAAMVGNLLLRVLALLIAGAVVYGIWYWASAR